MTCWSISINSRQLFRFTHELIKITVKRELTVDTTASTLVTSWRIFFAAKSFTGDQMKRKSRKTNQSNDRMIKQSEFIEQRTCWWILLKECHQRKRYRRHEIYHHLSLIEIICFFVNRSLSQHARFWQTNVETFDRRKSSIRKKKHSLDRRNCSANRFHMDKTDFLFVFARLRKLFFIISLERFRNEFSMVVRIIVLMIVNRFSANDWVHLSKFFFVRGNLKTSQERCWIIDFSKRKTFDRHWIRNEMQLFSLKEDIFWHLIDIEMTLL